MKMILLASIQVSWINIACVNEKANVYHISTHHQNSIKIQKKYNLY